MAIATIGTPARVDPGKTNLTERILFHSGLVNTLRHVDVVAEVERSRRVVDGVVLVASAVDRVRSQTRRITRATSAADLPTLIFVSKTDTIDRLGVRAESRSFACLLSGR
jgi:translation elongation factor EF-G